MDRLFCLRSLGLCLFISISAAAKRVPAPNVPPIIAHGVRYSAEGDGRNSHVSATDVASGKELWKVKVFHTRIEFWLEEDLQWVFISNLKLVQNDLLVRDEKNRCYTIRLDTHQVEKMTCGNEFPPQEAR